MKGFVSTLAVLLFFLVIFSLASVFSSKTIEFSDISNRNLILDKVYYRFIAIEHGIKRILEEESGFGGINITIKENNFNIVTFQEVIPITNTSNFVSDIKTFENFIENYTKETNLFVDLNITDMEECLPLNVIPYNIKYTHPSRPDCTLAGAKLFLQIKPGVSSQYLNSYDMVFKLINANLTSEPSFNAGCSGGAFKWNVTIADNNSTYSAIKFVQLDKLCKMEVSTTCDLTAFKVESPRNENKTLEINIPNTACSLVSTISLNLTDIPGKTGVIIGEDPQSIKVKETLYQIEKNDTVYIFGE